MTYYGDYSNRRRRTNTYRGWEKKGNWEAPWEEPAWPDMWANPWEEDVVMEHWPVKQTPVVADENAEQLTNVFHPDHIAHLMLVIRQRAATYTQSEEEKQITAIMLGEFEQKASALPAGTYTFSESYLVGYAISVSEEPETGRCTLVLLIGSNKYSETFIVYVNKPETEAAEGESANTATAPEAENQEVIVEQPAAAESTVSESTPAPIVDPKAIIWTIGPKDRWNNTGYTFQRNDGSYLDMTQVYEFIQRESVTNQQLAADFPFIVTPAGQPAPPRTASFALESKGKTSSYKYVFSPDYKKRWGLEPPTGDVYEGAPTKLPAIVVAPGGIRLHTTPNTADSDYNNKTGKAATVYPSNSKLTIIAYAKPGNPGWVKVRMANGSEGWIEERYVSVRQPGFTYYTVQAGDTIENIIKTHPLYKNAPYTTGFDRRNIAEAIALLNRTNPGIYREGESDHWFLDSQDPYFKNTRYNYDTLRVKEGTTLILPTVDQVKALQNSSLIGSRPESMNWMIGIEKGIWGFIEGIGIGFAEAAVDMVTGIWEMISGIVTGKLFTDMIDMVSDLWDKGWEGVWDMVKGMWTQGVESFENAWNNPNPEEKWKFFGKIVGMILFEVVLAILTMGVGAAVNAAAKTSVLVTKLPKLVKVIDALTPEVSKYKVPEVDKDRLAKKADAGDNKLVKSVGDKTPDINEKGPNYSKNPDANTKANADLDAEKTIDKNDKDFASKVAALAQAIIITNAADKIDVAPAQLVLDLAYLRVFKGVRGFDYDPKGAGLYKFVMLGSEYNIKGNYTVSKTPVGNIDAKAKAEIEKQEKKAKDKGVDTNSAGYKKRKQKLEAAVENFPTQHVRIGMGSYKIDQELMAHILGRHHPKYYISTDTARQSFFPESFTVDDIMGIFRKIEQRSLSDPSIKALIESIPASGKRGPGIFKSGGNYYQIGFNERTHDIGNFFMFDPKTMTPDELSKAINID